jgi:nickel-dependent lactate racemase
MSTSVPILSEQEVREQICNLIPQAEYQGKKVLLVVPDGTRTAPMPLLFDTVFEHLRAHADQIDVMIALGTHPPMSEVQICKLLGISEEERSKHFYRVGLYNHNWNNPDALSTIGTLTKADTEEISQGLLSLEVAVEINKKIHDYDTLLVIGPVFPHEVVGFSGGNKYFFPGIAGPDILNFFHWLGALITNVGIIGIEDTPVRRVVNKAAEMIPCERRALTFVVDPKKNLYCINYGTPEESWSKSAKVSGQVHIVRKDKPFHTVLSCAPEMYDEVWVAGKCMYKLEPVVADGGELIIYAPHLKEVSIVHGHVIEKIGYHVRDYFIKQWDKFKEYPWGVLAHSTHVRGTGTFENGVEYPRVKVTLASQVPPEMCAKINLGYRDPASIDIESYANREDEGVLLVRKAGEHLYRLND